MKNQLLQKLDKVESYFEHVTKYISAYLHLNCLDFNLNPIKFISGTNTLTEIFNFAFHHRKCNQKICKINHLVKLNISLKI